MRVLVADCLDEVELRRQVDLLVVKLQDDLVGRVAHVEAGEPVFDGDVEVHLKI